MPLNIREALAPDAGGNGDEGAVESTGTASDLEAEADPEFFDTTFLATKSDIPIATGAELPAPRPFQAIPRLAFVFNFNYVWDEAAGEWVRDTGNSGGGGGRFTEVLESQTGSVGSNNSTTDRTSLTDPTLRMELFMSMTSPPGGVTIVQFSPGRTDANGNLVEYEKFWDPSRGDWSVNIINTAGQSIDYEWQLIEYAAP